MHKKKNTTSIENKKISKCIGPGQAQMQKQPEPEVVETVGRSIWVESDPGRVGYYHPLVVVDRETKSSQTRIRPWGGKKTTTHHLSGTALRRSIRQFTLRSLLRPSFSSSAHAFFLFHLSYRFVSIYVFFDRFMKITLIP